MSAVRPFVDGDAAPEGEGDTHIVGDLLEALGGDGLRGVSV